MFTKTIPNDNIIPDTCTELPTAVSDMKTTTSFPVIVGTVVTVQCKPGHTQAGENTITCIKGSSFKIRERPTCTLGSWKEAKLFYLMTNMMSAQT